MYYIELRKMFIRKVKYENNIYYISNDKKTTLKKLTRKIKEKNIKKVICSNVILKNERVINYLYSNNIDIYDGRDLFKKIISNILEYLKDLGSELEKLNASILVNNISNINNEVIYTCANYFRNISIITNNVNKFKELEKKLEKDGIAVNITQNKKKSMKNAKIIINIDFPNELINKCNFNNNCIIINLEEDIIIKRKSFNGININFYDLEIEENNIEKENYNKNILFEAYVDENKIKNLKNIRIKNLIGNRGIIKKEEIILTNKK